MPKKKTDAITDLENNEAETTAIPEQNEPITEDPAPAEKARASLREPIVTIGRIRRICRAQLPARGRSVGSQGGNLYR